MLMKCSSTKEVRRSMFAEHGGNVNELRKTPINMA